eukprot:749853-Hanusia_phi.AAC.3
MARKTLATAMAMAMAMATADVSSAFSTSPSSLFAPSSSRSPSCAVSGPSLRSGVTSLSMATVKVVDKAGGQVAQLQCDKESILRDAMLAAKENCSTAEEGATAGLAKYLGGKGIIWSTDITPQVDLVSGNLSPRTAAEEKLLKGCPPSFRLACVAALPCSCRTHLLCNQVPVVRYVRRDGEEQARRLIAFLQQASSTISLVCNSACLLKRSAAYIVSHEQ